MARDRELQARTCKGLYEWYKARGICVQCGRIWAEPGHVRCRTCAGIVKSYDDRYKVARAERARIRRQELIEKGLCTQCGTRPATPGMRMCPRCRAMRNDSTRKYRIHQRTLKAQQSGTPPTEKERYSKWR